MTGRAFISGKFKLWKLLGSGSFAKILAIEDNYRPGDLYAAKVHVDCPKGESRLKKEYRHMKMLKGCPHVPKLYGMHKIHFNGVEYDLFIIEYLGPNLT